MVVYPDQISPMQLWGTLGWHLAAILCSWSGVTVRGLLGRSRRPSALQVERRRLVLSMSRLSPAPTPPPDMRATVACSTVQYSKLYYSTVQYSIVQYSTVNYIIVQYSIV